MLDPKCRIYARREFVGSDLVTAELWRPYAADYCYEFFNLYEADRTLAYLLADRGENLLAARCRETGFAVSYLHDSRNANFYYDVPKYARGDFYKVIDRVPPVDTICVAVHFCLNDLFYKDKPIRPFPLIGLDLIRPEMLDPRNAYAILDRRFCEMSQRTVEEAEAKTVFSGAALYLLG